MNFLKKHVVISALILLILLTLLFILGELSFKNTVTTTLETLPPQTQTAAVSDSNSSLIAHYTFDDTTNDSRGSNHGTAVGGPTYVDGKIGKAIQLDGVDDYVSLGEQGSLDLQKYPSFSISGWIKPASTNRQMAIYQYGFRRHSVEILASGKAFYSINNSSAAVTGNTALSTNQWVHVVVTYNHSNNVSKLYINGSLDGSGETSAVSIGGTTFIGSSPYISGLFFQGLIDDVRVYEKDLSVLEVSELYEFSGSGGSGSTTEPPPETGEETPPPSSPPPTSPPPTNPPPTAPPPVTGGSSSVFLSPSGNDSADCTKANPCRSFDRAYRLAVPGGIVELAGGDYGNQTIQKDTTKTSSQDVIFRPASGASVHTGAVEVHGSHIEFQDMRLGSYRTHLGTDDVTFRNINTGWMGIYSSSNINIIGGEVYPGPDFLVGCSQANPAKCDYDPAISEQSGSRVSPRNILIDGVSFHGWLRPVGSDFHTECLQVGAGVNVTIRNSKFWDCATHDIFVRSWGGINNGVHELQNWLFENNYFAATTDGFYSINFGNDLGSNIANVTFRNNSFLQSVAVNDAANKVNSVLIGNIIYNQATWGCTAGQYRYNIYETLQGTGNKCDPTDKVAPIEYVNRSSLDLRISAGSPAIDFVPAGIGAVTDFFGQPRPRGAAVDAGAYEYQGTTTEPPPSNPPPTLYKPGDLNKDGSVNTTDFSLLQSVWNQSNTTYDLTGDGTINTLDYVIMIKNWTG